MKNCIKIIFIILVMLSCLNNLMGQDSLLNINKGKSKSIQWGEVPNYASSNIYETDINNSIGMHANEDCSIDFDFNLNNFLNIFKGDLKNYLGEATKIEMINTIFDTVVFLLAVQKCKEEKGLMLSNSVMAKYISKQALAKFKEITSGLFSTEAISGHGTPSYHGHKSEVDVGTIAKGAKSKAVYQAYYQTKTADDVFVKCLNEEIPKMRERLLKLINWKIKYQFEYNKKMRQNCILHKSQKNYDLMTALEKVLDLKQGENKKYCFPDGLCIDADGNVVNSENKIIIHLTKEERKEIFDNAVFAWKYYAKAYAFDPFTVSTTVRLLEKIENQYKNKTVDYLNLLSYYVDDIKFVFACAKTVIQKQNLELKIDIKNRIKKIIDCYNHVFAINISEKDLIDSYMLLYKSSLLEKIKTNINDVNIKNLILEKIYFSFLSPLYNVLQNELSSNNFSPHDFVVFKNLAKSLLFLYKKYLDDRSNVISAHIIHYNKTKPYESLVLQGRENFAIKKLKILYKTERDMYDKIYRIKKLEYNIN